MTNPRDRIEELRVIAEKANPSLEWKISGDACVVRMGGEIVADYSMARRGEWETDAEYLVAFQPSVVLSLLQALSDAQRQIDGLTGIPDAVRVPPADQRPKLEGGE